MKAHLNKLIVSELKKYGWVEAPETIGHVVIAHYPVDTYVGKQNAEVLPITMYEIGSCSISANFITKQENALTFCNAYFKNVFEIAASVEAFHVKTMADLEKAFSVRVHRNRLASAKARGE